MINIKAAACMNTFPHLLQIAIHLTSCIYLNSENYCPSKLQKSVA